MALMSGGMATIAGGVLAAYIGFLGGDDPVQQQLFASHLLSASIMSAPAALVAAKMLVPETEAFDEEMNISREKIGSNALAAISNGTSDGLRLAVNVGAMLLVFTALMAMLNYICQDWIGEWFGLNEIIAIKTQGAYSGFTMQYILGQLFSPLAWLIGVRGGDVSMVGQLLGEKTVLNEFFAYVSLGELKASGKLTDSKSIIIATYALCGFANFASIGIQIGGIGAIAPKRRELLSSLGIKALIAGTVACLMTGAIAGMLL
jgi:CNT family concentrative nucleoside transporter